MKTNFTVAYLVSEYPAISHAFIYTEIVALRKHGINVETFSINPTKNAAQLQQAERDEIKNTTYIKNCSVLLALWINISVFMRFPFRYLKMFLCATSLKKKGPKSLLKGLAYLAEAGILVHELLKRKIPHIHNHFGNAAATVAMIAQCSGFVSYSLSIHGPTIFDDVEAELLSEKIRYSQFARCISYFCQSQVMKAIPYSEWGKLHLVRCGVNLEVFKPIAKQKNTVPSILCVGRLVSQKGQHILIEASVLLHKQNVPHKLILVGCGPDRDSLEALVRRHNLESAVSFTGAVGQHDLVNCYASADLVVLPSFSEGVPVVLMEAMAMKIPVVSTNVAGIPELVEADKEGLLVFPSSVEGLAQSIKKLLGDDDFSKRCSHNACEKVHASFDIILNTEKLVELFRNQLLERGA